MQRRNVGASGLTVSALGLGTMNWGQEVTEEAAREQLRLFTDAGGTLVETAARYGEVEPWAWARLTQRLRAIRTRRTKLRPAAAA